ncbi:MAG: VOC family protein [Bacteroidetes bacterium]|nr:VOC family protein [Bacteroidota bacterium]
MFKKLRTVIYHVSDLQQAKEWYIKLTGNKPYFDEPFYVGFDFGGHELGLHPEETDGQGGNQSVSYWSVDDIEQTVTLFVANGANIHEPVTDVGGGIKAATVIDPWGNAVGFITGA